jgi:hypothetical protein
MADAGQHYTCSVLEATITGEMDSVEKSAVQYRTPHNP